MMERHQSSRAPLALCHRQSGLHTLYKYKYRAILHRRCVSPPPRQRAVCGQSTSDRPRWETGSAVAGERTAIARCATSQRRRGCQPATRTSRQRYGRSVQPAPSHVIWRAFLTIWPARWPRCLGPAVRAWREPLWGGGRRPGHGYWSRGFSAANRPKPRYRPAPIAIGPVTAVGKRRRTWTIDPCSFSGLWKLFAGSTPARYPKDETSNSTFVSRPAFVRAFRISFWVFRSS